MIDQKKDGDSEERSSGEKEIERRLMGEGESRQDVIDAATQASEMDREDPDNPERRERKAGVEDPSHSKGSTRRSS